MGGSQKNLKNHLKKRGIESDLESIETKTCQDFRVNGKTIWVLQPQLYGEDIEVKGHHSSLSSSAYGRARDLCGSWYRKHKPVGGVEFEFLGGSQGALKRSSVERSSIVGALVGLGLAQYVFLDALKERVQARQWNFKYAGKDLDSEILREAEALFTGMNLARHLTNMPAGLATPPALADALKKLFQKHKSVHVDIWGLEKLKKEKMGLLLGVGQGSASGARLVHLKYRPHSRNLGGRSSKRKNKFKPLAFVGKGVTFDTGGLDIKPSAAMRLMKKDMAGAAAMAGLCHFVASLRLNTPCDFYLPLAENAVSDRSMRPGDILRSRSGHFVEVDNTDAEGRLVMADAMDVAVTQKGDDAPEALIDVSTLTGAMRVALGLEVAGFFSNSDEWAKKMEIVAQQAGEYAWRMPLIQKYSKQLSSSFADFKNSSDSGYGGAITAALFLEKFVRQTPWVHFDVMSWNPSADGAICDGANGQCYQTLAQYLLSRG